MNIKLFIACHKLCDTPKDELYLPLHVGAEGKQSFGFTQDNTGDNISIKNPLFCELTGLYWCNKNLDYDFLGLVHYRRYFTLKSKSYIKQNGELNSVLTKEECEDLLNKYKIIVPKKRNYYIESLYSHYSHTFDENHLIETKNIIKEIHPSYLSVFDKTLRQRSAYIFNMFIMNKELVNEYCDWLFSILFELEKRIDTINMTAFEKRYIGRVSERLFNVWLNYKLDNKELNKEDIKEIPYMYIGQINWNKKIISFLKAKLFNKKYEESF